MTKTQTHLVLAGSGIAGGYLINKVIPIGFIKCAIISTAIIYGIAMYADFKAWNESLTDEK
jgi:hypothetical protein